MLEKNSQYALVTYVYRAIEDKIKEYCEPVPYNGNNYSEWVRARKGGNIEKELTAKLEKWIGSTRGLSHYIVIDSYNWGHYPKWKMHCISWFARGCNDLFDIFFDEVYGGLESAYEKTENSEELAESFLKWFEEKREKFMEKMDVQISELTNGAIKKGVKPSAHGGIANLLKILTKTMDRQGADIRSIAKVQYAVCVQAGVYIPDEFLNDVAVGLDVCTDEVVE